MFFVDEQTCSEPTLEEDPRGGTCPHCGFWNHPDANVNDDEGAPIFCNQCHQTFEPVEQA